MNQSPDELGSPATPPDAEPSSSGAVKPPPSPWAALMALISDVRESARGRIRLFSLEIKRTGSALGQIVALGLLAAFMAHLGWIALVVLGAWTAIDLGAPWWAAMIGVVVLHFLIAGVAVLRIMKLTKVLGMPATMRHLLGKHHESEPDNGASASPLGPQVTPPTAGASAP